MAVVTRSGARIPERPLVVAPSTVGLTMIDVTLALIAVPPSKRHCENSQATPNRRGCP
jgi:hypothetical protein